MATKKREYWFDQLFEKHECFHYDDIETLTTEVDGRHIDIIVPKHYPAVTILKCGLIDSLLLIVGHLDERHLDAPMGVLIVAKHRDKNVYETVVWHELFPWALGYLGLMDVKFPKLSKLKKK